MMQSVELFAGAGGLAIGMSNAGFNHVAVVELDHSACETFRENQRRHTRSVERWPLHEGDVREFDYGKLRDVAVVSGGPPCQPFSLGGKHRGWMDERDLFPEAVRAVRELRPKAFIFENVKGLTREAFSDYFEYIQLQLTHPSFVRKKSEDWSAHRTRLEGYHTSRQDRSEYNVVTRVLNAADYGVPQRRERVFFVGFQSSLGIEWSFPEATHSESSLLWSQWVSGEYWERHEVPTRRRPQLSPKLSNRVARICDEYLIGEGRNAWLTVRDAICDLREPTRTSNGGIQNHELNPGARRYPGHTGSPLDGPAKTLKAGDHGVPGGENMLSMIDGSVRYFTVREAARLQTFPDDYSFQAAWTESMRQLGNAVPVRLAEVIASSVADSLRTNGRLCR